MLHTSEVMAIFVIFGLFWPTFGCHGNVPQTLAFRNVFFGFVNHKKTPVISNNILVISHRNAFMCIYSNFSPKMVAMVTPLCPLCTGVSQMNSPIAKTLSQNQTVNG